MSAAVRLRFFLLKDLYRRIHPPFSFGLAQKKTGRGRSKRIGAVTTKTAYFGRLVVNTGVFSDAAREARKAFAKCAGHRRLQFHAPACDSACRIWGCWLDVTSFSFRAFRFATRCPGGCSGRCPHRPAAEAFINHRPAAAKISAACIPDFPGLKVSPRAGRFRL